MFGVPPWVIEADMNAKWWWYARTHMRIEGEVSVAAQKKNAKRGGRR